MIESKDINWYLAEPNRLLKKKPFTRGGTYKENSGVEATITSKNEVNFSDLKMNEISQDIYLQEYDPSLHKIRYNKSIPHIAVKVGDTTISIDDMTIQSAYEKNIHADHVQHLTNNPMEFILCNPQGGKKKNIVGKAIDFIKGTNGENEYVQLFQEFKQEWVVRGMESVKYDVISKREKLGDVALLFIYDKVANKTKCKVYSYDDGYIAVPNYNEYGEKIATSLYYTTDDGIKIIDTFDDKFHYRLVESQGEETENGWIITREPHGFSRCPLLYSRGRVAWEYAISTIEMWELMANINSVALKRFGTFGLVLIGAMNRDSFQRDSSTLVINLTDNGGGKPDAKTIEFPEPQKMLDYLDFLESKIATFASVSFINPKDIKNSDTGGNGIFMTMKNSLALATQSVADWADFTNNMAYLFQEGLSLEASDTTKYTKLKISAKLKVWSMESETTKITNLAMESKWLSKQTIIEQSPHAAPDELERVYAEQKQMQEDEAAKQKELEENANKAQNVAVNKSNEIIDNIKK